MDKEEIDYNSSVELMVGLIKKKLDEIVKVWREKKLENKSVNSAGLVDAFEVLQNFDNKLDEKLWWDNILKNAPFDMSPYIYQGVGHHVHYRCKCGMEFCQDGRTWIDHKC